jgi:undecaprenyl-diphosphatase
MSRAWTGRTYLWLGAALALAAFAKITEEMLELSRLRALDVTLLVALAARRGPLLTAAAVDLTALGSPVLVVLHSAMALVVLLLLRDRRGAFQLSLASGGAALWTLLTKDLIERARPDVVPRLVEVSGFSYPSGHSSASAAMYLTIALIAARYLPGVAERALLVSVSGVVVGLVALSRVYLGVHYPSDVAGGVCLGAAWAFLVAGGLPGAAVRSQEARSSATAGRRTGSAAGSER